MTKVAIILLLISFGLLIIYGLDVMIATQSQTNNEKGFLPLNESVRGAIFGGGAVALSVIGFAVGRKEPSKLVSILLFINGGLIILGMLIVMSMHNLDAQKDTARTIGSTMLFGGILIALGITKVIIDKKKIVAS